jgi:hypothetical protein
MSAELLHWRRRSDHASLKFFPQEVEKSWRKKHVAAAAAALSYNLIFSLDLLHQQQKVKQTESTADCQMQRRDETKRATLQ